MIGRTWSGLPDSWQHLSSRWLSDPLTIARISTEAPILLHRRLTTLSHFPKETSKVLFKNHVQQKCFTLKQSCLLDLRLPCHSRCLPPPGKISQIVQIQGNNIEINHLQLLLWIKGGGGRHLQTIGRLIFFLNIKKVGPFTRSQGRRYICISHNQHPLHNHRSVGTELITAQ